MLNNIGLHNFNTIHQNLKKLTAVSVTTFVPRFSILIKISCLTLFSLVLSACTTTEISQKTTASEKTIADPTQSLNSAPTIETKITETVVSPFGDLNLIRIEISPALIAAAKAPYAPLADKSCDAISIEVRALDNTLGPDLDAPGGADPDLIDKGSAELGNAAVGALRRTVEGAIPFRSWIRKFSGAEKHSREVATAVAAGIVRRSFLKGLGQASGCQAPAAPRQ